MFEVCIRNQNIGVYIYIFDMSKMSKIKLYLNIFLKIYFVFDMVCMNIFKDQ